MMQPPQIPADWRQRIGDALTGKGMTLPVHVPLWRVVSDLFFTVFGPLYLLALLVQVSDLVFQLYSTGTVDFPPSGDRYWFLVTAPFATSALIGGIFWFRPNFHRSARHFRMALRGTNAAKAFAASGSPPILYLRAFDFDERAESQSQSRLPMIFRHNLAA